MNDVAVAKKPPVTRPTHKVRFVTAASLFDGHDASINIMRRILQATGCEVIHLGHNRSVEDIVTTALQEDAHGIAVSSYQGGHVEFFKYMLDLLRERGGANIKVFGGGGGVIIPSEIDELQKYGVTRIFSPEDGQRLGLQGMINEIVTPCDVDLAQELPKDLSALKSGGALLGDRIRMNAIQHPNIYMRSMATREAGMEVSKALPDAIAACKVAGFDLIVVETSGIGQGDAAIVPLADCSLYVMTPEFGAASQLEKIDMLDFADFVAINKFDRKGAADALRDVRKQYQRNRELFSQAPDAMPVYGTIAARFNDDGVTALYQALCARLTQEGLKLPVGPDSSGQLQGKLPKVVTKYSTGQNAVVPPARVRYLAEIADTVRGYHGWTKEQSKIARERQQLMATKAMLLGIVPAQPVVGPD